MGTVKEPVTHLGVVISQDYNQARKLTYDAGKTAMKKAAIKISTGIPSTNLILKSQAVNVVVSSINNHRYRVFVPTLAEIEDTWKITKKALWTTSRIGGGESTKHKISQEKVVCSLDCGGLALIHPKQAAATSLVASSSGIYRHAFENPTSILNIIDNPLREAWSDRLHVLNGRNIADVFSNLKRFFPPQDKPTIISHLPEIFSKIELDEHLLLSMPTFHHILDPNQRIFNTLLKNEKIRMPNATPEILPSIGVLCHKIRDSHNLYDITKNSDKLDNLNNVEEKRKLEKLRTDIQKKFERNNRSEQLFRYQTSDSRRMETIGMRMLYAYKEVNQAIKRTFRGTAWMDNPDVFIPNPYKTR